MQVNVPPLTNLSVPAAATPLQRPAPPSTPVETARAVPPAEEDSKSGDGETAIQKDGRPSRPGRLLDIRV